MLRSGFAMPLKEKLVKCRLIVWPAKKVPRGTNGGVSLPGLIASACGAFVVTICSLITLYLFGGISFSTANDVRLVKIFICALTTAGMSSDCSAQI